MKPVYENKYLAGAVFELHAAEDVVGKEGTVFYKKDQLVEKLTTSKTGSVKSSLLPLGKYYLVEVSAPEGYVYSTERANFTLSAFQLPIPTCPSKSLWKRKRNRRRLLIWTMAWFTRL